MWGNLWRLDHGGQVGTSKTCVMLCPVMLAFVELCRDVLRKRADPLRAVHGTNTEIARVAAQASQLTGCDCCQHKAVGHTGEVREFPHLVEVDFVPFQGCF